MECTSGWIRTKNGFIVFKNRDRKPEEKILSNFFNKKHNLITFEDKKFKGCWLGINKHIGIVVSFGPYRETPKGYTVENEIFEINKKVLKILINISMITLI